MSVAAFFDAKIDFRPSETDRHESNKEIVLKFCFRRHWSFRRRRRRRRRGSVNLLLLQVVQVSDVFKTFLRPSLTDFRTKLECLID